KLRASRPALASPLSLARMEAAFGDPKSGHAAPLGARSPPHDARGKTALHAASAGQFCRAQGNVSRRQKRRMSLNKWVTSTLGKGCVTTRWRISRDGSCQEEESPLLCLRAQQSPGALAEYHRAEVESGGQSSRRPTSSVSDRAMYSLRSYRAFRFEPQ